MTEQYVTMADLEDFKKQLIADMKNAEVELHEQKGNMLLVPVYHKWIYNTPARNSSDTPFCKLVGCPLNHRIWDGVRKVTCNVIGVNTVAQIPHSRHEMALDFADKLCEFIYEYIKKNRGEA